MDAEECLLQIVCRKNMAFCAMLRVSTNLCKSFFLREMLHDVNDEHIFWDVSVRTGAILKAGKNGGETLLLLSDVLHMTLSLNHSLIAVVSSHSMN